MRRSYFCLIPLVLASLSAAQDSPKDASAKLDQIQIKSRALVERAGTVTKTIGELASSGKLPQSDEALQLMKKLVDEMSEIRSAMKKLDDNAAAIRAQLAGKPIPPTVEKDLAELKKTTVGGFIQVQFQNSDRNDPANTAASIFSGPYDAFRIRRTRLNIAHVADENTKLKIAVEFASGTNQQTAQLKDAYLDYNLKDSRVAFRAGQFNTPIGYDIERSDTLNEFPERSIYNNTQFNGERIRGITATHPVAKGTNLMVGLIDSLSVNDPEQANLQAGAGNKLSVLSSLRNVGKGYEIGISGLAGQRAEYSSIVAGALVTSPQVDRRFLYLDGALNNLFGGKWSARGEVMLGNDRVPNATAAATRDAHPMSGYQLQVGYQANPKTSLFARWEQFDPNKDAGGNLIQGFGLSMIHNLNSSIRLMLAHEIFVDESRDGNAAVNSQTRYGVTTIRVQFKF